MPRKLYGTYTFKKCDPNATTYEKYKIMSECMERLLKKSVPDRIIPDFDTMEFIVHEGFADPDLSWYDEHVKPEYRISVGIKYEGEEKDERTTSSESRSQTD